MRLWHVVHSHIHYKQGCVCVVVHLQPAGSIVSRSRANALRYRDSTSTFAFVSFMRQRCICTVYLITSHHRRPTILIFVTKITMLMTRLSQRLISAASISLCCVYTQLLLLLLCGDVCLIDGGVSLTTAILATCR